MNDILVKKEKVIKEFREELNLKGIINREKYDKPFFLVLNELYPLRPRNMTCHINRFDRLTFVIVVEHTYIYIEWTEKITLLSITIMDGDFDDGGIYHTTLEDAIEKIKDRWKKKI